MNKLIRNIKVIIQGICCALEGQVLPRDLLFRKQFGLLGLVTRVQLAGDISCHIYDYDQIVNDVEANIYRVAKDKDIKSSKIGDIVMNKLKRIDKVAYIRFASVYRDFADISEFKNEIKKLGK